MEHIDNFLIFCVIMEQSITTKFLIELAKCCISSQNIWIFTLICQVFPECDIHARHWKIQTIWMTSTKDSRIIPINFSLVQEFVSYTNANMRIVFKFLNRNIIFKVKDLILTHKVVEPFIETANNIIFCRCVTLTLVLEHWIFIIIYKVPSHNYQDILHRIFCNNLNQFIARLLDLNYFIWLFLIYFSWFLLDFVELYGPNFSYFNMPCKVNFQILEFNSLICFM